MSYWYLKFLIYSKFIINKIVRTEPKNALFLSKKLTIWTFFRIDLSLKTKYKSESSDIIDEKQNS